MSQTRRPLALSLCVMLCGCGGVQRVLGNDGQDAVQISRLFWIFLSVTTLVYVAVIAFLIASVRRQRSAEEISIAREPRGMRTALIVWTGVIALGLSVLAVASFLADRVSAKSSADHELTIKVTARQWWWDVEYRSADASQTMRTANELHLPVGVPTRIELESSDVIHSLWIPNLAGKKDLIPGRRTDLSVHPLHIGQYRGQCAEFCGLQHSRMALDVTVESEADFKHWWLAGLKPAAPPETPLAAAGMAYVTTRECSTCHAIAGTAASAHFGPDLTHVASRRNIAAGTLPMSRANLAAWVRDPQAHKQGADMPNIGLSEPQANAIAAYLDGLK
jgi:cytochrome c oxidase subunit II